ncbi:MAG: M48 family metallopeptidase [Gammaproteobacteria bacterium]|nr:M48 family metallopeptidase [Gammaproteobacteria bacterium]
MDPFSIVFLVALGAHVAVQVWLARRHMSHVAAHRGVVPACFAEAVSADDHARAADYTVARQRLGIVETVFDACVLLWLTLGGGIAWIGRVAGSLVDGPIVQGTLLVLGVFAALALLSLPFSIYRTFALEQRFGFNRTTPAVFVTDQLKGWALGLVLGGLAAACVLWIMSSAGSRWWIVAWLAWMAFTLLITWAWPRVIAPLFNRFTPLEDQSLRTRIDALLDRCGFHAKSVFVMDGSRRSSHGNAYFTGLGREKRIVFFDTLLTTLTPPQVESVLAHELAHFKLKHVPQRLVVGALVSLAGFGLLGWLSREQWFYEALGVPAVSDAAALVLFVLVTPVFTWLASPLLAAWSRRHEYQADAFAADHADAQALAEALVRLYKDNASTLTPDPLYSAFYDSHPPPAARIERLRTFRSAPERRPAAA